jgi:hypothetical protein
MGRGGGAPLRGGGGAGYSGGRILPFIGPGERLRGGGGRSNGWSSISLLFCWFKRWLRMGLMGLKGKMKAVS